MKEGRKRILGRTGDFLFGGLFILVGIWIIVFIVAHVVTGVHLPEQPSPLVWLLLLLQAFLGMFLVDLGYRFLKKPKRSSSC